MRQSNDKNCITFHHQGKLRKFYKTGQALSNGDIPGHLGKCQGFLRVTGEGFKFLNLAERTIRGNNP